MRCTETLTDRMICHCLQVKESQIADSVTVFGAGSVKDVVRSCGAGGGCNSCHAKIRQLIELHGPDGATV
ncbi:MAG: (2Fe-2S)-binding protein [Planctomycetaceae bacterium]|nr:(2Fe-2S)-binding protein [Planctomycetaceae bacterium]MCA9111928.1 (2Fe-2S)-binding protein [Planctomycetaceae bacterium]